MTREDPTLVSVRCLFEKQCPWVYHLYRQFHPEPVCYVLLQSNVFFEPVSPAIHSGENCVGPAIMLGALLAMGRCSLEGMDHKVYYSYWECPKLLLEAEVKANWLLLLVVVVVIRPPVIRLSGPL